MLHRKNEIISCTKNLYKSLPQLLSNSNSPNITHSYHTKNPKFKTKKPINPRTTRQIAPRNQERELRYDSDSTAPEFSNISSSNDAVLICTLLCNSVGQSRDFDNLLKGFKNKISSELVLEILMNYKHLGRTNTLEFFSWAGFQMGFRFEDSVIEYMADFLGRRKLFDDLKCLLKTVYISNGCVSSRAVSICIRFLGRQGRVKDALSVFEQMEAELNCKPDNFVFNNMLYVLCKKETSGEFIDAALVIFRKIESPDVYSYSNILVGLCKFSRVESAVEVFHEMCRAKLVPTKSAVNILVGELCKMNTNEECLERVKVTNFRRPFTILVPNVGLKGGAIKAATNIFWSMGDLGVLPSPFIINQLISELCKSRKIEDAIEIFRVVENRKMRCLEESYSIVIQALCEVRKVNEACELFGKMLSQDLKPKLAVYNSVICMLCKSGSAEKAGRVFEIMNKKRCGPDNVTYTALIHGYGWARNWEAAYDLLTEMLKMGWCPHFHTYDLVDKLLKERGHSDLAQKLEGKLEIQMLHKYCRTGKLEAAYEKLSYMFERGFRLPMFTREAFERAFQKAGKQKIARELLKKIDHGTPESTIEPEV
ncbi:hypothetical protein ACHQM5_006734 [Ranunculus cassubicifolius]